MNAIKYYGVFRGSATMPIAAFAVGPDAEDYASHRRRMTIRVCYMDCGYLCSGCGGLVHAVPISPCDDCELSDGCLVQPFTPECEAYKAEG